MIEDITRKNEENSTIDPEQLLLDTNINYQTNISDLNSTNQIFNVNDEQIDFSSTVAWMPVAQEILNEQPTNNSFNEYNIKNEKNTVYQDNFDTDNLLNDLLLTIDAENMNSMINPYNTIEEIIAPKTLKDITADADICKCIDCKCDVEQGCQGGCGPDNYCKGSTDVIEDNNNCSKITEAYVKKKCCGTDKSKSPLDDGDLLNFSYDCSVKCSCKSISDGVANGCCVVICLKTFESLQSAYNKNYKAQINFAKNECQIIH